MASDEELMLAAGRGDLAAFGEIVQRNQTAAWNAACRFLDDAGEAEDAAQEAFLRILKAAPRYRPTASFRTYLYCVLTNICLNRLGKRRPTPTDALPAIADQRPLPLEAVTQQEREAAVRAALDELPPRQRAAIILRHFEGLSYADMAESMSTSVKSVERLLSHARQKLQHKLGDFAES